MKKLTDVEVTQRMQELRNLRTLHAHDRQQIAGLKAELAVVGAENVELKQTVATLQIQMAELQTMAFGKKRKPPTGTVVPVMPASASRTKDSYRRPIPPSAAITSEVAVLLPKACVCGSSFKPDSVTTHERYVEDIPLPELTTGYQPRLVTKYVIERGICRKCGKATSAKDLGGQMVALGPNIRLLVTHLVGLVGMSYQQVTALLLVLYGSAVSDGEISAILQSEHKKWLPAYNRLKADIRAAPVVHVDETPWKIQQEGGGYAWALADASSPRVCYDLTTSRGAPHAKRLFGQDTDQPFTGVRISDDYGPYRNPELPGKQQLCWAHLYRCIRDVRYNENLPKEQLPYVTQWYTGFVELYKDLRVYLEQPYDEVVRVTQATKLWQRVQALASESAPSIVDEPEKLARLKAQLLRAGKEKLFTCLVKDTPCDNNRAERDLRQLVLKRKRSFGSQTEKGAQALSTVLSICTTTWRCNPTGYFRSLAALG